MQLLASTKIESHIDDRVHAIQAASAKAVRLSAEAVFAEARRRVPVGATHKLAESLSIAANPDKAEAAVVSAGTSYALFVEHGTKKMHARPFLRPGAAMGRQVLKAEAETQIRSAAR